MAKEQSPGISDNFAKALIAVLPSIAGGLFGGTEGAAAAASAGIEPLKMVEAEEASIRQEQRELAAKKQLMALEREEKLAQQEEKRSFELQKMQQEQQLAEKETSGKLTKEIRSRHEADPITKSTKDIVQSFKRIEAVTKEPSPAGDIALIFNYMKMLDPASTVREGEFATAAEAGSVPTRILAQYNKVVSGERLADTQRKDFVDQAKGLAKAQLSVQQELDMATQEEAAARGADVKFSVNPALVKIRERLQKSNDGNKVLNKVKEMNIDAKRKRLLELQKKQAGK